MKPDRKEVQPPIVPSFSQQPWLLQLHGTKEHTLSFINPFNGSIEERSVPEMQGKVCLGNFGEWILLLHRKSKGMSLFNLTSFNEIKLPPMKKPLEILGNFALSSCPTSPKCIITTVCKGQDSILYCRPKDQKWTKIRPIFRAQYSGIIALCQGKIYAPIQFGGYVVIIDLESLPTGAIYGEIIKTPWFFWHGSLHLVISSERFFLVMVEISSGLVIDAEIYTLDFSRLASRKFRFLDGLIENLKPPKVGPWVRVGSIDRHVFLLGEKYSFSLSANYAGVQGNRMYLLQPDRGGMRLYTICLEDQTTTYKVLLPRTTARNRLYWMVPSRSRSIQHRSTKTSAALNSEVEGLTSDTSVSWADVPLGVVQELILLLPLPDRLRLASVCKAWSSFTKFIQDEKDLPWLMCSKDCGSLKFFDTFYGVEYSLQMKWLGSDGKLTFHFSIDGWVVASDQKRSLFLLNPLTRQGIQLPFNDFWYYSFSPVAFSFSSVPTNSRCIVLAVKSVSHGCMILTWHRGQASWKSQHVEFPDFFTLSDVSPVFFNDEFYIHGSKGELFLFNPITKDYRFVNIAIPIQSEGHHIRKECYLLELNGELIYVLKYITMESYGVYKLDQSNMIWAEFDDLGDMTAFLSCKNSLSRQSTNRMYANGMLFLRFNGKDSKQPMFYSMQYHDFHPKSEDITEIMNCIWFEPNLYIRKSKNFRKMFSLENKYCNCNDLSEIY